MHMYVCVYIYIYIYRLTYLEAFLSDTLQSMKHQVLTKKVNQNIYPNAGTCDRMHVIGPKSCQLGPTRYT